MDPITAGLTFLGSLPDLIKLGQELMAYLNKASGGDPQGFVKNLGAAMTQLNAAQSDEERQNAAQAIADVLRGLP